MTTEQVPADELDTDPEPLKCTGAPERIFLVVGDLDQDCTFDELADVTWCSEQIGNQDIEYVRADTVANARKVLMDENMRLLNELRAMYDEKVSQK